MRIRILAVAALLSPLALPVAAADAATEAATEASTAPVSGAVFYRFTTKADIYRYLGGKFTKTSVGGLGQFSASPDGRKVAWVDQDSRLHVTEGRSDKVVAKNAIFGAPCATPVWSADSKRLAYPMTGTEATAPISVVNADGTGLKKVGRTYGVCHLAWSANGRYLAGYTGTTEGVHLLDVTTGKTRKAAGIKLANHVQSLSPDGRKVIIRAIKPSDPGGDGAWPTWFRPTVVDTVTGAKLTIPVRGTLIGAIYLSDGRLAVRVKGATRNTVVVLSKTLKPVQRFAEPASVRAMGLLQLL
ncbi:hypothetical protein Aph01nite_71290 [Acrocarpospora phusangensis]|uniref:Lipoprotein LpqB beta-propeller domain-containing protein n=1 Tax=Acrocarpospora phusangensis TaxID=1070424 RepID=A0A919UPG5_9ACTN|nr:hypothetical protein [Acrocarpospora phusangensis]GIH28819.1 hypothetical protein Aph01nite_71290 [Acrocarpospora phusangensis]